MMYQTVFKRYELKYILSREQKDVVLSAMKPYMELDRYGRTTLRNVYYDTQSYRLIRRSIEKPEYKEKLRIRSYARVGEGGTVFVELKKKYDKVVYKRRIPLHCEMAVGWLRGEKPCPLDTQISREVDYFLRFYGPLYPMAFLSYEREAFYDKGGTDFRVTFDDNILARESNVDLGADIGGYPLLSDRYVLMELKCSGGLPLWMTEVLSREHIYKSSFSKYGTAYERLIFPRMYKIRECN